MMLALSGPAMAKAKKRAVASAEKTAAILDSVTCRLKNEPAHFIRAEYVRSDLPLKVEIHLSGPKQYGYHGDYTVLTAAQAKEDPNILKTARIAGVNMAKIDRVVLFTLNGAGFTVMKFNSRDKTIASALNILGGVHLCAEN